MSSRGGTPAARGRRGATRHRPRGERDKINAELGKRSAGPQRASLLRAADLFRQLNRDTLIALAPAFDAELFLGNFIVEYLDPATGQYTRPQDQTGDVTELVRLAPNRRRIQKDIHQVGRYRITAVVRVGDFEQRVATEVDVLRVAAGHRRRVPAGALSGAG